MWKIGQKVKFIEDFEIELVLSGSKLKVVKGDTALVTKYGFKILSGEGIGKITNIPENNKVEGYDYKNISKLIIDKLNREYNILEFIEDYEIDIVEVEDSLEDLLTDIF